ncbi:uncharacterized protein LOC124448135 isoform X1 [Xenia sp. Carnegie-2017]|uniref:uncharacterized protein LOC124448135 isoform X1 n=1 Tax=Xenia sp. Carnegie-2017 TaxID=2897299 RepID=UPI001F046595|nr:uncharacterized protein LOC124448135 isoform X1 [Xenia sp. Carnegie-2017]
MVTSLIFWIVPSLLSLVDKPTMAVSLNKSSDECNHPLGVGDKRIADRQLTSPSFVSTLYIAKDDIYINAKPNYGRLNGKYAFCGGRFSYLQVNLSYVVNVTAVATQGLDDWAPSYVKTYRLRFSLNGQDWFNYSTPNKVWRGNINGRGIKRNNFNSSIQTQYLRFYPQRYNYERCLRVEVYGCKSSDPGQLENTSTTPRLTTSITDVKVTTAKTNTTKPIDYAKFTPTKTDATFPVDDVKVTPTKIKATSPADDGKVTPTKIKATSPADDGKVTPTKTKATSPADDVKVTPTKIKATSPADDGKVTPTKPKATSPVDDGKVTPTKPKAASPVDDGKVTPTKPKATTTMKDEKSTLIEVLHVGSHLNDTVVTEIPIVPHDAVSHTNVASLLGLCIGCFVLVALTIFVFILLKRKAAAIKPEDVNRNGQDTVSVIRVPSEESKL